MSYYYQENRRGPFANVPKVTKNLIIINIVVFVATLFNENFMIGTFGLFYPTSVYFRCMVDSGTYSSICTPCSYSESWWNA